MTELRNCGSCGTKPGSLHVYGCSVERCPRCGGQKISCHCVYEFNNIEWRDLEDTRPDLYNNGPTDEMYETWDATWKARRIQWSGEYPGLVECRELGFWCIRHLDAEGHHLRWENYVKPGTPGATEDLNRYESLCRVGSFRWDVDEQKWKLRSNDG